MFKPRRPQEKHAKNAETFGGYITELRKMLRRSLVEVADGCGISPTYLSELERDKKEPSDEVVRTIANYYGVNEKELFNMLGRVSLAVKEELEDNETLKETLEQIAEDPELTPEDKEKLYRTLQKAYQMLRKSEH